MNVKREGVRKGKFREGHNQFPKTGAGWEKENM